MSKPTYSELLTDPRWQKKRLQILERDAFTCRDCGDAKNTLHVHHCYYAKGAPWETEDLCLLTLCESCHEKRGELEWDAKKMLAQITSRLGNTEDDESLKELVDSLAAMVGALHGENWHLISPMVIDQIDFDYLSDVRWYLHACTHPEFRRAYEEVVGRKGINWARAANAQTTR